MGCISETPVFVGLGGFPEQSLGHVWGEIGNQLFLLYRGAARGYDGSMEEESPEHTKPRRKRRGGGSRRAVTIVLSVVAAVVAFSIAGGCVMSYRAEKAAEEKRIKREKRLLREKKAAEAEAARKAEEEAARAAAEQAEQEKREAEARAAEEAEAAARAEAERKAAEEKAAADAAAAAKEAEEKAKAEEQQDKKNESGESEEEKPVATEEKPATDSAYDAPLNLLDNAQSAVYDRMVDNLMQKADFKAFAAAMEPRIREAAPQLIRGEKLNYPAYKAAPQLVSAVDLCLLAELVSPQTLSALCSGDAGQKDSGRAYIEWLLRDKAQPLHALLRWYMLEEGDTRNLGYALATFYDIWKVCPKADRSKYLNLAIACALVHPGLVRSKGMLRRCKEPMLTMSEIFSYFREQDSKRKLLTDIRKMSPERLLNVVNFRLPKSELDWVNANMDYKRKNWGDSYSSVQYLMERATQNADPYKDYTLAEILEKGGVCRDQAYFCDMSAKVKGIPSIYATGDGDRGPHAWVVLLVDDKTWVPINNYGYTSGRFQQACSGKSIHEGVFLSQTKAERADKLAPAGDAMLLSYLLARSGQVDEARGAARFLTASFPTLTAAWTNLIKVLEADEEAHPVSKAQWEKVDRELNAAARKNAELADLAGDLEDKHLDGKRKTNLNQVKRNAGDSRADVVVAAVEREARDLAEAKNYRGLATLYNKQLKSYTDRGDIFQQLVAQYMEMLDEADKRAWATMAKDVEKLFMKKVRSDGSDYFKLTKEVEIQKLISQAYAKAGNTKKAEKLFAEATERLSNAKQRE